MSRFVNQITPTSLPIPVRYYDRNDISSAAQVPEAAPHRMSNVWLDTQSVAERLGISPRTVERMRQSGDGPKFCKAGRAVRYREAWIDD